VEPRLQTRVHTFGIRGGGQSYQKMIIELHLETKEERRVMPEILKGSVGKGNVFRNQEVGGSQQKH